jgi:hypothetical protein
MARKSTVKKNNEEEQIITLDGNEHKYSLLPDEGKIIVQQLNILEREITNTQMALARHNAAKEFFIQNFKMLVTPEVPTDENEKH